MKTIFFECNMGAAGDMIMAALLELHDEPQAFIEKVNNIGIPNVKITAVPSLKLGISGMNIKVTVNGKEETDDMHSHENCGHSHEEYSHENCEHSHDEHGSESHEGIHGAYKDITHLIGSLIVSDTVKENALGIYKLIADAESHIHKVPVNKIHFHEIGEMDAVADIVGVCMLMEELAPDLVLSSPVNVGSGQVRCAHGILPVPAPATALIMKDIPIYSNNIKGELCTPTGAAILKYFAKTFGPMPVMTVSKIGYGMGKKDFEAVNCVRAFIGETGSSFEDVTELSCNLDDMTPEAIAFAQQLLLDEGALDVYSIPIGMKKSRSGILFTCMCKQDKRDKMLHLIFKHTTTLGVRENISRRYTLSRKSGEVHTKYGTIRVKTAQGYDVKKTKPEHEDVANAAKENEVSIQNVLKELLK